MEVSIMSENNNVLKVKSLNKEIEALQHKRTKVESQKELLLNNLKSEVERYEKTYGVVLSGETLRETIKAIASEKTKVEAQIGEEYELKKKVVDAINRNDIAEANRLLGITPVQEEEDEPEEYTSVVPNDTEDETVEELIARVNSDNGNYEEDGNETDYSYEEVAEEEDDDDFGFGVDGFENSEEENEFTPSTSVEDNSTSIDIFGGIVFDEGESSPEDSEDEEDVYGDISFGDDTSEEDEDDFGFGAMLGGSKFQF